MMRTLISGLDIWDALFGLVIFVFIVLLLILGELIARGVTKFKKWRFFKQMPLDKKEARYAQQDVKIMLELYNQHMNKKRRAK